MKPDRQTDPPSPFHALHLQNMKSMHADVALVHAVVALPAGRDRVHSLSGPP